MVQFRRFSFPCILMMWLLGSCGLPLPTLEGVDLAEWKNDRNGCSGKRAAMIEMLRSQRLKLEGLTETQIGELLGRPDQNELYKRNQKFYHYFLEPGRVCGSSVDKPHQLSIRFNATERAKEVEID